MLYWVQLIAFVAGLVGMILSAFGLRYALLAHKSAKLAEEAGRSAEDAANLAREETRRTLTRNLSSVSVEKAIALIDRLTELHRRKLWEPTPWLYRDLRRTLTEISGSLPKEMAQFRSVIEEAIPQITAISDQVDQALDRKREPRNTSRFNRVLNGIRQSLETLQASMT